MSEFVAEMMRLGTVPGVMSVERVETEGKAGWRCRRRGWFGARDSAVNDYRTITFKKN